MGAERCLKGRFAAVQCTFKNRRHPFVDIQDAFFKRIPESLRIPCDKSFLAGQSRDDAKLAARSNG